MVEEKSKFERLFKEIVAFHGYISAGQVFGIRISMIGLREIGIHDPKGRASKVVFYALTR